MVLQMPHGDEKKDCDRSTDILKEERTSERKTRQESEETNDKIQCSGVSCEYEEEWKNFVGLNIITN